MASRTEPEELAYLESKGWTRMPVRSVWCWRQPGFHALFRKDDALETQRALDRENQRLNVEMRNKKGIKGS